MEFDERAIDAVFAQVNQSRLPGAAVGIAVSGRPVYRKGFGLANMELPVVLSHGTRMRIASITKHFASLAYLLLCEEGRARLDDTVGHYLGELHPVIHNLTLRQLMGHVSGIRDPFDIYWQFSGTREPVTSADLLSLYRDIDDMNAEPGTAWTYNSGGYLLLTFVIEKITGKSLEEVLRERIFDRVGMYDTLLRRWDTDFVANSAALHATDATGNFLKASLGAAMAGEAGMVSTVDDLLRWLAHMDEPIVGNAQSWRALMSPQILTNGTSTGYGLGLAMSNYRGVDTISHLGGVLGGSAFMLKVRAAKLDIVVLSNRQDMLAMPLAYKIVDICLAEHLADTPVPDEGFARGTFISGKSGRVIQLFERGGKQAAAIDGHEWPCVLQGGVLRSDPIWSYLRYSAQLIGDSQNLHALRFEDFGTVEELSAVTTATTAVQDVIAGCYQSSSTGTSVKILQNGGRMRMEARGRFGTTAYDLECIAERMWRALPSVALPWWGGILSFDFDDAGFSFTSSRTSRLPFKRTRALT